MDRNRGFDINALRQQMEELLEDFLPTGGQRRPASGRPAGDQTQTLAVNLVDAEGAFTLTAPLPGMQPEDIDVSVRGQSISIRAQRKNQPADRPNFVRREWGYASYQRGLELPGPVDAEGATASYRLGVITVTLPKADPNRPQVIPVEDADETAVGHDEAPEPEAVAEPQAEIPVVSASEGPEPAEAAAATEEAPAEPPAAPARGGFYMQQRGRNRGPRGNRNAKARAESAPAADATPDAQGGATVDVPVHGEPHTADASQAPEPAPLAPSTEAPASPTPGPGAAFPDEQAPTD